jgi:basic amino acid/polyamine antiporter, APA family
MRHHRLYRVTQSTSTPIEPASGHTLLRTMGLFSLVVYGVGDMIGSGIYGTVGKAAGQMGNAVWLAFVVSMVAAMLTGLSYACIASRYPRAAGAAFVTHHAWHVAFLSYLIGLTVAASGLTSMATSTNVFADNLQKFVPGPHWVMVLLFLGFLTYINFRGIRESMWTNILCTAVEVGGLLFVIIVGARYWGSVNYLETPHAVYDTAGALVSSGLEPGKLFAASVLTFFAFVGFEDMLNISEEVKRPERTMPWGIVLALVVATVLYIGVAVTAVSVVDYHTLREAKAPLTPIVQKAAPWLWGRAFDFITMFAVANTVLINYIMGSRLLYGMARQGLVPAVLARVHAKRRTPHVAIGTLLVIVIGLTISGTVTELGAATGLLLLCCFAIVNGALIALKLRKGEPKGHFEVPIIVPALGIVVNLTLVGAKLMEALRISRAPADAAAPAGAIGLPAPAIAGFLVLGISILYFIVRPKTITEETLAQVEETS